MEETDFSMNFIVAVLLAAVALLGIAIWSIKRTRIRTSSSTPTPGSTS
jgi:hypothetical protein